MLQLHKDLFARLAISAKTIKARELDKKIVQTPDKNESKLEVIEYSEPQATDSRPIAAKGAPSTLKLDEAVDKIIENPEVAALKSELAKVEEIFHKIKAGEDEGLISRVEKKIEQLKGLIEEKSYV